MDIPYKKVSFSFWITRRCRNKCNWCCACAGEDQCDSDMDENDVSECFSNIRHCMGLGLRLKDVHIIGGNPSCHPRFRDIAEKIAFEAGEIGLRSVVFTSDGMSYEDFLFLQEIGCKVVNSPIKDKRHYPMPFDYLKHGYKAIGNVCNPNGWNHCNGIGAVKMNGKLVFSWCNICSVFMMLFGHLDRFPDMNDSLEHAISMKSRQTMSCEYCRFCPIKFKGIKPRLLRDLSVMRLTKTRDLAAAVARGDV